MIVRGPVRQEDRQDRTPHCSHVLRLAALNTNTSIESYIYISLLWCVVCGVWCGSCVFVVLLVSLSDERAGGEDREDMQPC